MTENNDQFLLCFYSLDRSDTLATTFCIHNAPSSKLLAPKFTKSAHTPPCDASEMTQPWDYIAKLVCIGDSGTGKSSLTIRLCEGRFSATADVTIGVEFGSRIVPVSPSKRMKLSLWDTAGQETYKSITRSYFRGASGALLVFDVTRRKTFESATEWLGDLRGIAEDGIVVVLVGNKSDLASASTVSDGSIGENAGLGSENKRAVTVQEAEEWCQRNGVLKYVETSAKSGEGVEKAFLEVAERIYHNIEGGRYDLNDRRSGVKGPGSGGGGGQKTVSLGMNGTSGKSSETRGWGAGCC